MRAIDLTGQRFGRLVVIERAEDKICPSGQRQKQYICKCDCGNKVIVRSLALRNGDTKSCGCFRVEIANTTLTTIKPKHGLRYTRIYGIWKDMKQRCFNSKAANYHRYGGRGITMCEEWKNSPQSFYNWAMANGYSEGLSIDRINNDGNYEPNNCRWVTMKEQANNRSTSKAKDT